MDNKEITRAWYAAIDAKQYDKLKSLTTEDHQFLNPMAAVPLSADEHLGMIRMMTTAFDGQHTIDTVFGEGNHVAVSGVWSGTHVGDFNGIPPTGNEVEFTFNEIITFSDGKIQKQQLEFDTATFSSQLSGDDYDDEFEEEEEFEEED